MMFTSRYTTGKDIYFENYYVLKFWQHLHYDIVGVRPMTIIFTCFNKHWSSTVVTVNERQRVVNHSRLRVVSTIFKDIIVTTNIIIATNIIAMMNIVACFC